MNDQDTITVVITDDHAIVRKGLLAFFATTQDIRIVATAATGQEAVAAAKTHTPQVMLLDMFLPDQPAVQTIEQIKAVSPNSQIVILTSHEGNEYIADILKAGALSYILKDISPEDLINVVKQAASGKSILNARLAQEFMKDLNSESSDLYNSLTERERGVLHLIAKGMTNGEIADSLCISETTVKSHVSNILGKLYLADRTKVAVYAWENGLIRRS